MDDERVKDYEHILGRQPSVYDDEPQEFLAEPTKELLERARRQADREPLELTVRDLLGYWGARRRGYVIVETIIQDLAAHDLTTDPPFEDAWIDEPVQLIKLKKRERELSSSVTSPPVEPTVAAGLRVRHLQSANREVSSVPPDATLSMAQALMLRDDYSQLAILSGPRTLQGAVSWKSIAQAQLRSRTCTLRDAIIPAWQTINVSLEDELIPLIPMIVDKEFVFVKKQDGSLGGIITMADLSLEYNRLARPFFLIGEVERRLRRIVGEVFPIELLGSIRDPNDGTRAINSADDLTFGEYQRLLENPNNWEKINWGVDRKIFIQDLNEVRSIRNEVMHFSPDPIDEEQLRRLNNFIGMMKVLDPRP